MARTILVTGGAGFIGSNFVLQRVAAGDRVMTLDKLGYSSASSSPASSSENAEPHPAVKEGR